LVDTESSADILYRSAFEQMKIDRNKVIPARHSLVGFTGEQVLPLGSIELPMTAGTYPRQNTIIVRFLIIDHPSAYNAILGRTALNELKAVTSTPHLSMKFPTEEGVSVEKGDQWMARECYNTSLKKLPEAARLGERKKDDEKEQSPLGESVEELESFELCDSKKTIRVGSQLSLEIKMALVAFLRRNQDIFAWSHEDMLGIPPSVISTN